MNMNKITRVEYFTNKSLTMGFEHAVIVGTKDSDEDKSNALMGTMCTGFLNKIIKQARKDKAKIVKLKKEPLQIHWLK